MTPACRSICGSGTAHLNKVLGAKGYTREAWRALFQSETWRILEASMDDAALRGDENGLKAAYRVAWAVAEGPRVVG